jgi:hypothetical protein
MAMVVLCLVDEWVGRFSGRKNLTLRIWESCYHDLLIAPQRYRYGGPRLFARLAAKLLPATDLWILLDPAIIGTESKGQEVPSADTLNQLEACRAFVKTRKSYVILDALEPIDRIAEGAYSSIIEMLAQRAERELKHRF